MKVKEYSYLAVLLFIGCGPNSDGKMTHADSVSIQSKFGNPEIPEFGSQEKKVIEYSQEIPIPNNAISGDFNGDGINEMVWIISDFKDDDGSTCATHLKSNNMSIPGYNWNSCSTGISTLSDINGDGADDLYINHWGAMGNTNYVGVISLSKSGDWYYSVDEFQCMGESEKLRVTKCENGVMIKYNGGEETGDVVADAWAEHEKFIKPKLR